MIKKLDRDYCVIKLRKLPLAYYDEETESDILYDPKHAALYWLTIDNPKKNNSRKFLGEVENLLTKLNIQTLIFLDELNKPWISEYTSKRKDHKTIVQMLEFFQSHKIWTKFNGGVLVTAESRKEFLKHFFEITCCDGGFFNFNFVDDKQQFLFYLHYSGELRVMPLHKKSKEKFLAAVKETALHDAGYPYADRLE